MSGVKPARVIARPRVVIVTRKTPIELLLERHGTLGQARFYLKSRGESIEPAEHIHDRVTAAIGEVGRGLGAETRRARVDRDELAQFLFGPDDVVVVVGQDGLVPNAAKYLTGQPVIGVNPDASAFDGVLCRHAAERVGEVIAWLRGGEGSFGVEERCMAEAKREDGQRLLALNEVFVGHRTHQSAKYVIEAGETQERQSSSGVIFSTGTGSTGWARSIARQRELSDRLPNPTDSRLAWFVREPFPSVSTKTTMEFGVVERGAEVSITSHMGEGGVIFADGIENDAIEFVAGQRVRVTVASHRLRLVVPRNQREAKSAMTKVKPSTTRAMRS